MVQLQLSQLQMVINVTNAKIGADAVGTTEVLNDVVMLQVVQ